MTNLGLHYSKSIIRKFDYIPVYIPDTKISPGAIISFGTNIFGKAAKPFGVFHVVSHLMQGLTYHFDLKLDKFSSKTEFNFISENEVDIGTVLEAKLPNVVEGDIEFNFKKAGSVLLFGVQPTEERFRDQFELDRCLESVASDRNWEELYVVTSVITCKKALVYQSNDKDGKLILSANAKKIKIAGSALGNIGAEASFHVKWKSNHAFSIDWADDVVLFMKLKRFKKSSFQKFSSVHLSNSFGSLAEGEAHEISYVSEELSITELR